MNKKYGIIGGLVVFTAVFLGWLFIESSKTLPGTKVADDGREHVDIGTEVNYATNPPTSGKHYADWIRAGVYPEPKDDRNLVHSLEHGYVIMSYNCKEQIGFIKPAIAQESTASAESSTSGSLSANFQSDSCKQIVDQLSSIYEKKGAKKLIVIPRPNMDETIALTAWTYIDKFNLADSSKLNQEEIERIEKFIDAHWNQGPELTME